MVFPFQFLLIPLPILPMAPGQAGSIHLLNAKLQMLESLQPFGPCPMNGIKALPGDPWYILVNLGILLGKLTKKGATMIHHGTMERSEL